MKVNMFRPLEKMRYSDQVAHSIQDRILTGRVATGARLPSEKDLAEEFQVSRTVIREAMRLLESSGCVEIKKGPTGGIFVAADYHKPTSDSLRNLMTSGVVTLEHVMDLRWLLEPHMVAQAALKARPGQFDEIQRVVDLFEEHRDDPAALKQANLAFHRTLGRASGNPVFSILLDSVLELLEHLIVDFVDLRFEREISGFHREIFEAVAARRPDEARKLVERDIIRVREVIGGFYETRPGS
ncbi:MAG: FadR family transcriptional regulator [Proteobacteria bacterium]|nr:FadR family transcriptional regulator [Pseudomonadota bacterium]